MGFLSDRQAEGAARLREAIEPLVGHDETLVGVVTGVRQTAFSGSMFAIGVTDRHLLIRELDRKMRPTAGAPLVLRPDEIDVGNLFSEGAALSVGTKAHEIRFTTRGEDFRFMVLGGTMLEDALAGDDQVSGLHALVDFLRAAG